MALSSHETELCELLQDFHTLTGIRIILFDENYNEILEYPPKEKTFCFCLRKCEEFDKKCRRSDEDSFLKCRQTKNIHIFKCHAGLSEATAPIIENGHIIGYMMFGQVIDKDTDKTESVSLIDRLSRELSLSPEELQSSYDELEIYNEDKINSAANILKTATTQVLYASMRSQACII